MSLADCKCGFPHDDFTEARPKKNKKISGYMSKKKKEGEKKTSLY